MSEPVSASRPAAGEQDASGDAAASLGECNICFDAAQDPMITMCGHLYCWPCIYQWLERSANPQCPVCKANTSKDSLIPVFGRGEGRKDPRSDKPKPVDNIPPRPRARRSAQTSPSDAHGGTGPAPFQDNDQDEDEGANTGAFGGWSVSGFGLIPTLLGINFISVHNHGGNQGGQQQSRAPQTARQDNQDFVSRLLLFVGVMVIVMLLLI